MRAIHLAEMDKARPVVVLTREAVRPVLDRVTVAPVTTRVRGIATEVPCGSANGLDFEGVINCDNIATIHVSKLGRHIGYLLDDQEGPLTAAIHAAFDLDD